MVPVRCPTSYEMILRVMCNVFFPGADDYNRVVLEPDSDGYDEGDYINASYVDVSCASRPPTLNLSGTTY